MSTVWVSGVTWPGLVNISVLCCLSVYESVTVTSSLSPPLPHTISHLLSAYLSLALLFSAEAHKKFSDENDKLGLQAGARQDQLKFFRSLEPGGVVDVLKPSVEEQAVLKSRQGDETRLI